jgi:hypothetical protein
VSSWKRSNHQRKVSPGEHTGEVEKRSYVTLNILLYMRSEGRGWALLRDAIRDAVPSGAISIIRSPHALAAGLRRAEGDPCLVVLFAEERDELRRLFGVNDLLADVPVFLILPDWSKETLKLAHRFRPRFLISRREPLSGFVEVLRKKSTAMKPKAACSR